MAELLTNSLRNTCGPVTLSVCARYIHIFTILGELGGEPSGVFQRILGEALGDGVFDHWVRMSELSAWACDGVSSNSRQTGIARRVRHF